MTAIAQNGNSNAVLSSDWTGLSPHLIARFYEVQKVDDSEGAYWSKVANSPEVRCPITDGTIEQVQNWTSPFENVGMDARLSTFSSMLQSGGFGAILNALQEHVPKDSAAAKLLNGIKKDLGDLRGLSGVTKLNSTQIYTGSPPLKLTFTAHFQAHYDSRKEVQAPVDQLMMWALPKKLAPDGTVTNLLNGGPGVRSLYASEAPPIVAMQYADMLFSPMVIEHAGVPLTAPRDKNGHAISTSFQISLSSLTALDRADWSSISLRT